MFDDSQIFLCYVHEDVREVEALYRRLMEAGFNVWMDTQRLLPGQTWPAEIKKAIKHSRLVIICLSRTWVQKRGFSKLEFRLAEDCSKEKLEGEIYRIPARLDDCEIPESLADIQWVDLFAENGWEQLVRTITTALGQSGSGGKSLTVPTPKVFAEKEWEPVAKGIMTVLGRSGGKDSPQEPAQHRLLITSPPDEAQVERQTYIEGHVSDPHAAVWLIVHPVGILEYWVQSPVSIRGDGRWGVEAYFGKGSDADAGKRFEMMAVSNPEEELKEGKVLPGWPATGERSQVLTVTKRAAGQRDAPPRPDVPRHLGERSVNAPSMDRSIIITGDKNNVSVGGGPRSRKP
jgi:hypothetical protein